MDIKITEIRRILFWFRAYTSSTTRKLLLISVSGDASSTAFGDLKMLGVQSETPIFKLFMPTL